MTAYVVSFSSNMRGDLKINAFQLCVWGHAMAHTYSETRSRKELRNAYFKSEEVLMAWKASAGGALTFSAKTSIQPRSLCRGL